MKLKMTSHPLFRCMKRMRRMKVALVTNHRYKKFARTGHPSGPTKFSCFYTCDAGRRDGTPAWN
jgi:hypothetical protein